MEYVVIARQGHRLLGAPVAWGGDQLQLGVIVDGDRSWQVPIGSALARGYWEEDSRGELIEVVDPHPWRARPSPSREATDTDWVSWEDRDLLLNEVVMGVPETESQVPSSPAVSRLREKLVAEVRDAAEKGYIIEPLKD